MGHKFADIVFTDSVKTIQSKLGSRNSYASMEGAEDYNNRLGDSESEFISLRDSFYMASVGETGWPYVQHRGGPKGFVKILDENTIGFADFSGNRQYVSVGNFSTDDRVSLIFMDYPNRRRLKILGRVQLISLDDGDSLQQLEDGHFRAQIERGIVIKVEAFDWNCPQFITPRYTEDELAQFVAAETSSSNNRIVDKKSPGTTEESVLDEPNILGEGPLHLEISGIRQLTPDVRAYQLRSIDGSDLPPFEAGSHLRIPMRLEDGSMTNREYSISSDPGELSSYEIAVYREQSGRGGSKAVHADFELGTQLKLEPPINQFRLHTNANPALLIAGGIGITPIKSMAHAIASRGGDFQLLYAGKSRSQMAFEKELADEFGESVRFFSTADKQRLNVANALSELEASTEIYVCGPESLTEDVVVQAGNLGIPRQKINFEMFS